jgi:hypothetical protein
MAVLPYLNLRSQFGDGDVEPGSSDTLEVMVFDSGKQMRDVRLRSEKMRSRREDALPDRRKT